QWARSCRKRRERRERRGRQRQPCSILLELDAKTSADHTRSDPTVQFAVEACRRRRRLIIQEAACYKNVNLPEHAKGAHMDATALPNSVRRIVVHMRSFC